MSKMDMPLDLTELSLVGRIAGNRELSTVW